MKTFRLAGYLLLLAYSFMQAGASLFAITVNVSTMIEAPPQSLHMVQGPYGFNPEVFWDNFPNVGLFLFVLALILNWSTGLRKWVLIGFGVHILAALSAIFLLEPVQTEFLEFEYSDTVIPGLKVLGNLWLNYSLLFWGLTLLSGIVYILGITEQWPEKTKLN